MTGMLFKIKIIVLICAETCKFYDMFDKGTLIKKSVPLGYDTVSLGVEEESSSLCDPEDEGTTIP